MIAPQGGALITHANMELLRNITDECNGIWHIGNTDSDVETILGIIVKGQYDPEQSRDTHENQKQHSVMKLGSFPEGMPSLLQYVEPFSHSLSRIRSCSHFYKNSRSPLKGQRLCVIDFDLFL